MSIDVLAPAARPKSAIFPIIPTPYEAESVPGYPQSSRMPSRPYSNSKQISSCIRSSCLSMFWDWH
jgi:hypothetical protein